MAAESSSLFILKLEQLSTAYVRPMSAWSQLRIATYETAIASVVAQRKRQTKEKKEKVLSGLSYTTDLCFFSLSVDLLPTIIICWRFIEWLTHIRKCDFSCVKWPVTRHSATFGCLYILPQSLSRFWCFSLKRYQTMLCCHKTALYALSYGVYDLLWYNDHHNYMVL